MQNDQGECVDMYTKNCTHGVYKNPRLMHCCMTIVGSTVYLQTKDGSVWEGIFKTFDPKFTICLDFAVQVDPKLSTKDCFYQALKKGSQVREQAFFELEDIVHIAVIDIDLNYATKDATLDKLTTDSDISGFNPSKLGEHRELETWQDDDGDDTVDDSLLSLDEIALSNKNSGNKNNSRGWDAHEMFKYNEKVHKVSSTYDEKLIDYTIALNEHNSEEWQSKQKRAAAIAKEIEKNPKSLNRLAKEDGSDDEEEKFSAVVRPGQQSSQTEQPKHQSQQQQSTTQQKQSSQHQPQHHHNREPQQQHHAQHQKLHHQPLQNQHQHHQQQQQQPQHHHPHPNPHQHQQQNSAQHNNAPASHQRPLASRMAIGNNQNWHNKNFRPRFDRARIDSLKNFGKQLTLTPQPGHGPPPATQQHQAQSLPQTLTKSPHQPIVQATQHLKQTNSTQSQSVIETQADIQPMSQSSQQQQSSQQKQQQQQNQQPQLNQRPSPQSSEKQVQPALPQQGQSPSATNQQAPQAPQSTSSSQASQSPVSYQSEIVKKSTLNPNAKEFKPEFKPRSPASVHSSQSNGPPIVAAQPGAPAAVDPANANPVSQTGHEPYYQQLPIFPHGFLPPHQQHHAPQFLPNHAHMQFQNPIYYMSPPTVAPHFGQPIYGMNDMSAHTMQGRRHMEPDGYGPAYVIPAGQYRFETPPPNSFAVQNSWRDQDQNRVQMYRRWP